MKTKVTKVKFTPYKRKKIKGFISITINDEITINGFKLIKGKNGDYIGFPAHYSEEDDKWYNDFYISDEDEEDEDLPF